MKKILGLGVLLGLLAATLLASPVQASGAGAVSFTQTFHDATESFPTNGPCTSETGIVTITYNGVAHATVLTSGVGAGTGWFTFTATGTFSFEPLAGGNVTYSGKFTIWDGENINLQNYTATFTQIIHGTGSDGSTINFHEVAHVTVAPSGDVTITFDKSTCS
jgi:hypothetical protein